MNKGPHLYRAGQFADRAGVTVRALRYYDRLGLLKPSGRTAAGYRLYAESDLVRLEQIVALKFIGFPLRRIRELLGGKRLDLPAVLRFQRKVIEEKRRRLDLAVRAIEQAERVVEARRTGKSRGQEGPGQDSEWDAFRKIVEVISMQQDWEFANKYYTEEELAELRSRWSPELQVKAEQDWGALIRDVEAAAAAGEDPASERSQALAARWQGLIDAFTGGNEAIAESLKRLYADKSNWPAGVRMPYSPEVGGFICKAAEVRNQRQ